VFTYTIFIIMVYNEYDTKIWRRILCQPVANSGSRTVNHILPEMINYLNQPNGMYIITTWAMAIHFHPS